LGNGGTKLIDETPYNERSTGRGAEPRLPYDVIITNQLIASAEYSAVSIHSAIRAAYGWIYHGQSSARFRHDRDPEVRIRSRL
jgi:hypothetical protein